MSIMWSIAVTAGAVSITLLADAIRLAADWLARRDDLNFPVSPSTAGGGGSAARPLSPCILSSLVQTPRGRP